MWIEKLVWCSQHLVIATCIFFTTNSFSQINDEDIFNQAQVYYDRQNYKEAIPLLKQAIEIDPLDSEYHHLLAKCYGRRAENAIWFKAISLSKKTVKELEKAVELNGQNIGALRDLKDYYMRAPGFLGGNKDKADEIERHLIAIDSVN